MEIANLVKNQTKVSEDNVGRAPVPTSVRRSSVPNPESTRGKGGKKQFRKIIEQTTSKVESETENEGEGEVEEVFSRTDEPEIRGTIIITIYKNHPYEVEFGGDITGNERDLAWRAMMKQYAVWKNEIRKEQERIIKVKEEAIKRKEEADARN